MIGQNWLRTPISDIVTAQYLFNSFVTARQESMQPEDEIRAVRDNAKRAGTAETIFRQYARNPKLAREHLHLGRDRVSYFPKVRSFFHNADDYRRFFPKVNDVKITQMHRKVYTWTQM